MPIHSIKLIKCIQSYTISKILRRIELIHLRFRPIKIDSSPRIVSAICETENFVRLEIYFRVTHTHTTINYLDPRWYHSGGHFNLFTNEVFSHQHIPSIRSLLLFHSFMVHNFPWRFIKQPIPFPSFIISYTKSYEHSQNPYLANSVFLGRIHRRVPRIMQTYTINAYSLFSFFFFSSFISFFTRFFQLNST